MEPRKSALNFCAGEDCIQDSRVTRSTSIPFMTGKLLQQGLDLDSGGFVLASPPAHASEAVAAEQEAWAAQSDKKTSEFLANLTARGGKAIGNAGVSTDTNAVKLFAAFRMAHPWFGKLDSQSLGQPSACVPGGTHATVNHTLCLVRSEGMRVCQRSLHASVAYSFCSKSTLSANGRQSCQVPGEAWAEAGAQCVQ